MLGNTSPIKIILVNKNEYRLSIMFDNWELSKPITENALKELQEQINKVTGISKISEAFSCTTEEAKNIKDYWNKSGIGWNSCKDCSFFWKECNNCVNKCQSPLERDLFIEMRKHGIEVILQRRINKDGSYNDFPSEVDPNNILTIPDFFIEKSDLKLCVYADGHTYHGRTENQSIRDRNIDRELQKLGYKVLRYTGKEIRSDLSKVVENIKSIFS